MAARDLRLGRGAGGRHRALDLRRRHREERDALPPAGEAHGRARVPHEDGGARDRGRAEDVLDDHEIGREPLEDAPGPVEERLESDLERVPGARPDDPRPEHGRDPAAALERRVAGIREPRIEPDGARSGAGRDGDFVHPPQAAPCASSTSSGMSKFA